MKGTPIRVDNREPATLTARLTYLGYQVENLTLKAGDFEGKTIIGEIKRETDFYRSIVDQRIYYQPQKMIQTGKECYWIIAGDPTDERRHLSIVLDTIINLALHSKITLIPIPNKEAAIAYAIHNIMQRRENRQREVRQIRRDKHKFAQKQNIVLELLLMIPGIGTRSARTIINRYPTIAQLARATKENLIAIPRIGNRQAQLIYNTLRGKN